MSHTIKAITISHVCFATWIEAEAEDISKYRTLLYEFE